MEPGINVDNAGKKVVRVAFWAPGRDSKQREMVEDKIRSLGCSIGWFLTPKDADITIHSVKKPDPGKLIKTRGTALMEAFTPFLKSIEVPKN